MKVTLLLTSLMLFAAGSAYLWADRSAATDTASASPHGVAETNDVLAHKAGLPKVALPHSVETELRSTSGGQAQLDETRLMLRVLNGAK